jgi:hypothetical protein
MESTSDSWMGPTGKSLNEWRREVKKLKKLVQQLTSKEFSLRRSAWALGLGASWIYEKLCFEFKSVFRQGSEVITAHRDACIFLRDVYTPSVNRLFRVRKSRKFTRSKQVYDHARKSVKKLSKLCREFAKSTVVGPILVEGSRNNHVDAVAVSKQLEKKKLS